MSCKNGKFVGKCLLENTLLCRNVSDFASVWSLTGKVNVREEFSGRELWRRLCEEVLRQEARKRRNTMLRATSGSLSETKD